MKNYLEYEDLDKLLFINALETSVGHYLYQHYRFQYQTNNLLRLFASLTKLERQKQETRHDIGQQLLLLLCHHVQQCPKFEQRTKFSELLNLLQHLVVQKVLDPQLEFGLECEYASLCLEIRHIYLHTASIRGLHDPKYRRRSTKHPLAPFLPRDYTWIWRQQCSWMGEWVSTNMNIALSPSSSSSSFCIDDYYHKTSSLLQKRQVCLHFTRFFGMLFEITSLYLESNLDGTFEECIREALVSGNVEGLLLLCISSDKPIDVDGMCLSVSQAGEQLWTYLDTIDDWMSTNPTPEQLARQQQQQQQNNNEMSNDNDPNNNSNNNDQPQELVTPPDWLMPDRYKIHPNTRLRLKMLNHLYELGWNWLWKR
ncbi:unnamed protein product [Cunninghamella echinulata]